MKKIVIGLLVTASLRVSAQDLYRMPEGQQSRVSSFENPNGVKGNGGKTNNGAKGNAFEFLKAGESKTLLDVTGAGVIQRIWITIADRSFYVMRSLRLQMFWDGDTKPAVDVPFGDFFCAPLGRATAFQSALFSNPEARSFNCYIPMPFKKSARIVLTNEGTKDAGSVYYDVDFISLKKAPENVLYFHAHWNREVKGVADKDFEMLPQVKGKGRFLGVNVGVNVDSVYGSTWWGEGEVKMYIDGDDKHPSFNGTGTEDYIGTGWGEAPYAHLYQGCMVADEKKKQYSFYRFHVPDQVFFYSDFKATLQKIGGGNYEEVKALKNKGVNLIPVSVHSFKFFHPLFERPVDINDPAFEKGWVNFWRVDDYCATAYFYLDKTSSNLEPLVKIEDRVK